MTLLSFMPFHCIINDHQDLILNLIYLNSTDTPLVGFRTPFGILYEQSFPTYSVEYLEGRDGGLGERIS